MDEVARLRDSARAAPLARSARQSVATCHQAAVLRRERRAAGLRACDRGAQFVYQIFCVFIHSLTPLAMGTTAILGAATPAPPPGT